MRIKAEIYIDGACSGNPGPGAWAVVIVNNPATKHTFTGYVKEATNARMELTAAIEAVKRALNQSCEYTIYSDSEYVIKGINEWRHNWKKKGWRKSDGKPVENQDLWITLDTLLETSCTPITWQWVRGHSGNPMNELANELAQSTVSENIGHEPNFENPHVNTWEKSLTDLYKAMMHGEKDLKITITFMPDNKIIFHKSTNLFAEIIDVN
jgi:ribonuclease HI